MLAVAAMSTILFPSIALAETSSSARKSKDPLDEFTFGQWHPMNRSVSQRDATLSRTPPTFCTYLVRFLIHYDTNGVGAWWNGQQFKYSSLSANDRKTHLLKEFGSMSKTTEIAIAKYIGHDDPKTKYGILYNALIQTYGNLHDAKRHLAILFSILPTKLQPSDQLLNYYKFHQNDTKDLSKSDADITARESPYDDDRLSELLPKQYRIIYDKVDDSLKSISFSITPAISLFEVGITNDKDQTTGSITKFGPMGGSPLIRDQPNYTFQIYSLLGLAGATGCALTHGTVIPLDVIKTRFPKGIQEVLI